MARVTRVKAAQQRYQMVPVLNEDGTPKRTPVMRTDREGNKVQKVTKRGSLVFMNVTVADKDQPLPNRKCGKCSKEIQVGDPYKHTSVKSSYGGTTYYRCASCPDWLPWELSSSLSARAAEISHDFWDEFNGADIESADEVTDMLNSAAERVRGGLRRRPARRQGRHDGAKHQYGRHQIDEDQGRGRKGHQGDRKIGDRQSGDRRQLRFQAGPDRDQIPQGNRHADAA